MGILYPDKGVSCCSPSVSRGTITPNVKHSYWTCRSDTDIDAIIKALGKDGESELLTLLDGENQIDHVLNIATTNYPEILDKRITSRPRRFDRFVRIEVPSAEIRRAYLMEKLKDADARDVDEWVEATEGFSFACLAECIISVQCLGNSFESTIERLKKMLHKNVSSHEFDLCKIGFR